MITRAENYTKEKWTERTQEAVRVKNKMQTKLEKIP